MHQRRRASASVGEVISQLLERLSHAADDPLPRLQLAWGAICGGPAALHSEPLELVNGVLFVGVRGRDWREALYRERTLLRAHVRRVAPKVRAIRLRSLPEVAAAPPAAPSKPAPHSPRTAEIAHEGLRRACDELLALEERS